MKPIRHSDEAPNNQGYSGGEERVSDYAPLVEPARPMKNAGALMRFAIARGVSAASWSR